MADHADAARPWPLPWPGPAARKLAAERGLDWRHLSGTGPKGRVTKADVLAAKIAAVPSLPAAPRQVSARAPTLGPAVAATGPRRLADQLGMVYQARPLDGPATARADLARAAKPAIPHFYESVDCAVEALEQLAQALAGEAASAARLELALLARAAGAALAATPALQGAWDGAALLIAADAAASIGWVGADGRGQRLQPAAQPLAMLGAALEAPDTAAGLPWGGVAVLDLRATGLDEAQGLIPGAAAALLALAAIRPVAVVEAGQVRARRVMRATLATDHRVADGVAAAHFLAAFKAAVEAPLRLAA